MKKMKLIKKGVCLATVSILSILLVACSNSKNILANKKFLAGIDDYNDTSINIPKAEQYLPNGEECTIAYPYVITNDGRNYSVFSVYDKSKVIFSGAYLNTSVSTVDVNWDIPYLCVEVENVSTTVYDLFGNVVLPTELYDNYSITISDDELVKANKTQYVYTACETILYSIDGKIETCTNKLEIYLSDSSIDTYEELSKITRTKVDSYYANTSGSLFSYGSYLDLSYCGLEGYSMYTSSSNKDIYNKKNELVATINPYDGLSLPRYGLMDGYMIVQMACELPADAEDFDYYQDDQKIDLITYCINLKNGKRKELEKFEYVLGEIVEITYDNATKKESHNEVYVLYSSISSKIVDKHLVSDPTHLYFNAKGKILANSSVYGFSFIRRLDETHYLAYDNIVNGYWLLNEKVEKISFLGRNEFEINTEAKAISIETLTPYCTLIDYDGKIISSGTYTSFIYSSSNNILAKDINGDYWLLVVENGEIKSTTKTEITGILNNSLLTNANYSGQTLLLYSSVLGKIEKVNSTFEIELTTLDGTVLVDDSCSFYSIRNNNSYFNSCSFTLSLYSSDNTLAAIYVIE